MSKTKRPLGVTAAVMVIVGLVGCGTGHSQTAAAPPPAATTAPPPATTVAPPPSAAPPAAPAPEPMSHHKRIESVQTALNANGAKQGEKGRPRHLFAHNRRACGNEVPR